MGHTKTKVYLKEIGKQFQQIWDKINYPINNVLNIFFKNNGIYKNSFYLIYIMFIMKDWFLRHIIIFSNILSWIKML